MTDLKDMPTINDERLAELIDIATQLTRITTHTGFLWDALIAFRELSASRAIVERAVGLLDIADEALGDAARDAARAAAWAAARDAARDAQRKRFARMVMAEMRERK